MAYKNRYFRKKFNGQSLVGQDLSHTEFTCCDFTDADLTDADCSYSDFTGSLLVRTKCTNTNFAHTKLACKFEPSDAFGITWTLECRTFSGMQTSKLWWFSMLYFAMLIKPELDKGIDLRDELKKVFGGDRFERLKNLFLTRQL